MKRQLYRASIHFPLVFVGILVLFSCKNPLTDEDKTPVYPSTRDFLTYNWIKNGYDTCSTTLLAAGKYCIVYGEKDGRVAAGPANQAGGKLDAALGKRIAKEFDEVIYPKITGAFGEPLDVDGNGRVILLLMDIQDGYDKDRSPGYMAGYFHSIDMYSVETVKNQNTGWKTNQADMLYIDTSPSVPGGVDSYTTIAHEFQHLISFSQSIRRDRIQDLWIDEGLSSAAEHIYAGIQQSRLLWFSYPACTAHLGNNFFVWHGAWEEEGGDSLTNYSTVYLFFQWLRIHAANGIGIYKDIINSPYNDYRAVTEAAKLRIDSRCGDWEELLRGWLAASLLQDSKGYTGYNDELAFKPWYYRGGFGGALPLAPGEGVFSLWDNTGLPQNSNNIHYARYGSYLLSFNANSAAKDKYDSLASIPLETAVVGVAVSLTGGPLSGAERSLAGEKLPPAPEVYRWDGARHFLEKIKNPGLRALP